MTQKMNLSHVLTNFLVAPADDYRSFVRFHRIPQSIDLVLAWESEGLEYTVETVDQEIEIFDQTSSRGMFSIVDDDGNEVIFVAYSEVDLNQEPPT